MKQRHLTSIKIGAVIAMSGTALMLLLLQLNLLGPAALENDKLTLGGTLLFIFLYIFVLVGLYVGLMKVKRANKGILTFSMAFKTGTVISLATGLFAVVLTFGFYEVIYPTYNAEMTEVIIKKMQPSGLDSQELEAKVNEQTRYYSTAVQAQFAFVGNLLTGLAFTTLLGLFLKSTYSKNSSNGKK